MVRVTGLHGAMMARGPSSQDRPVDGPSETHESDVMLAVPKGRLDCPSGPAQL